MWMNGWMNEWMNGWMNGWMDGGMDGWMDGGMDEWMNGWMNGWIIMTKWVHYHRHVVSIHWLVCTFCVCYVTVFIKSFILAVFLHSAFIWAGFKRCLFSLPLFGVTVVAIMFHLFRYLKWQSCTPREIFLTQVRAASEFVFRANFCHAIPCFKTFVSVLLESLMLRSQNESRWSQI